MARKSRTPIDMSTVLTSSTGTLAQIKTKTNSLTVMANIVRQICPDLPEDAFNIANFHQNTLIIEVKSPIWGQRLQFERNNICTLLIEQTNNQFQKIEIKVNPHAHRQLTKQAEVLLNTEKNEQKKTEDNLSINALSSDTAKQLLDIASNAPKGLKEKLEKLARAADKKNN
ncbi:MAG: DciA family protein [Colwellia sp.]